MNPALAAGLLCAALGLALAFAPARARAAGLLLLVGAAALASLVPLDPTWTGRVAGAALVGAGLCAGAVHLPRGLSGPVAVGLAGAAGVCAGVLSDSPAQLAAVLPWALLASPGAWLVASGRGIVVKVIAGWLIAASLLTAVLPLVTTPAYQPDHME